MNADPSPLPAGEGQGEGAASPGFPPEPASDDGQEAHQQAETEWFGAIIALGAWAMFFAALVFAVGYLRMREPWPIAGALAPPRLLPGLGVLQLALASALLHWARRRPLPSPSARGPILWSLVGAAVLGLAFLGQQAYLASSLWGHGLRLPSGGAHASAFYGLMAVHAVHAVLGLFGLARLAVRLMRGGEVRQGLRLWNLYWHFVTVTGVLFFAAVYLA